MTSAYREALDYLFSQLPMFSRVGAPAYKPGLETSIRLDNYFGNPHKKFRSIHVGGTNGKGSTSHMIASVLQEKGLKVGLYTSPHLVDFRERMRINGKMIPKENVVEFVRKWRESGYEGKPSFFELTMIMAFNWFAEENVDIAVIEVGMGGRLDSTNIITPELSVITNISKDHTQFLGDSLEKIAAEKAGIIKPGIPVVVGEKGSDEIKDVFLGKAAELNAPITFAEDDNVSFKESDSPEWRFLCNNEEYFVPLPGEYQKKNIATVMSALKVLNEKGFDIPVSDIREGLAKVRENTGLAGRWMIISGEPLVICDTGHNIAGMTYNMAQLQKILKESPESRLHIVIGFVADKAIDEIMDILPHDALYYVTNARIPRALPYKELKKKFDSEGFCNNAYPDVVSAYEAALKNADKKDVIFIGGSTFVVADLLAGLSK